MRKGLFIMSEESEENALHWEFEADINILNTHSTTITINYEPIINCNKIVQSAQIKNISNMDGTNILRAGDKAKVKFKFRYRSELININDIFIFREGNTRGIGLVTNVF